MLTAGNALCTIPALTPAREMLNIRRGETLTCRTTAKNLYIVTALALALAVFFFGKLKPLHFPWFLYSSAGWSQRPRTISSSLWWSKMVNTAAQRYIHYIQPSLEHGKEINCDISSTIFLTILELTSSEHFIKKIKCTTNFLSNLCRRSLVPFFFFTSMSITIINASIMQQFWVRKKYNNWKSFY